MISPRASLLAFRSALLYIVLQLGWIGISIYQTETNPTPPAPPQPHHRVKRGQLEALSRPPDHLLIVATEDNGHDSGASDESETDRSDPTKFSPTGFRYGDPDPCADYQQPDFTLPKWQETCRVFLISEVDCQAFLEFAWSTGDTSVDATFMLPVGCLN